MSNIIAFPSSGLTEQDRQEVVALAYQLQLRGAAQGWITGETINGHVWMAILDARKKDSSLAVIAREEGQYVAFRDDGRALAHGPNLGEVLSTISA